MDPENPLLDDFALSLAGRARPKVCFVPTAGGDSAAYVARFYRALSSRCVASDLTLIDSSLPRRPSSTAELAEFVAEQDVFYVGGGSTLNLLSLWRAHGLDRLLREAWLRGAVLCGVSAGMNCWFEASLSDSIGRLAPLRDGLGLLGGSACPHYDGEADRRPVFRRAIVEGFPDGYGVDDGAALHFVGTELRAVVSSRVHARAYRVERRGTELVEEAIPTRYLGARASTSRNPTPEVATAAK